MLRAFLLTTVVLSFAAHAAADDVARCRSIDDDRLRLACYDTAAGRTVPEAESPDKVTAPAAIAAPAPTAAPQPATPGTAAAASDPVAGFGAEQLPASTEADGDEPDRIESSLPGRFEGWNKDTLFRLENGQVWQCVNCRDVYYVRENPRVAVERSFLGGYWLRVEGLNQRARVRRVR